MQSASENTVFLERGSGVFFAFFWQIDWVILLSQVFSNLGKSIFASQNLLHAKFNKTKSFVIHTVWINSCRSVQYNGAQYNFNIFIIKVLKTPTYSPDINPLDRRVFGLFHQLSGNCKIWSLQTRRLLSGWRIYLQLKTAKRMLAGNLSGLFLVFRSSIRTAFF